MSESLDTRLANHVLDGGRLRALLLELWQRTRMDWGFVTDRLSTTFRKETWIGAHERRFVGEVLYGLVRHLRRIDAALDRGAKKAKRSPRDLERLLALLVLERAIDPAQAARLEGERDWAQVATIDAAIAAERDLATRIGLAASLPDWLAKRLVTDWGARAEPLALALNQRAPMTVRANTLVSDRVTLAGELARNHNIASHVGEHTDTALILDTRINLFATPVFKRGAMEAQDEGSQLLAELATGGLAETKPLIVDLCAGAGGKTLAIAARLANRGRLVATDVDAGKLDELRKRARRATVSNARAVQLANGAWPQELDGIRGKADVVLVDAPCSGLGSLRRNPEARWRLREADLADFAKRQQIILSDAVGLLGPGGRLIYATCTLLKIENVDVVAAVTATKPGLTRVPLVDVLGDRAARFERDGDFVTTPDAHGTDGFYASVLKLG